ncbi:hypothetical protein BT96DRAFT_1015299 [Gymnopus androsaceus JB14]|uniref:Uncharacterized protein n=1 Tax=Gymnopus androsaceus JB14 TaxID=1447944 RepID=A0A6A4IAP7_9AGAR|nr:hypothetical protein BT96DRAFT_1015299 [Gymnopus androsaceus JB14]
MPSQFDYAYNPNWSHQLAHPDSRARVHLAAAPRAVLHAHTASPYARARAPTAAHHRHHMSTSPILPTRFILSPVLQLHLTLSGSSPIPVVLSLLLLPSELEYLPRRPEHSGFTSEEPIKFFSKRVPGVSVTESFEARFQFWMTPKRWCLLTRAWKRTQWIFDYPGLRSVTHRMQVVVGNRHITRLEVTIEICMEIKRVMRSGKAQIMNTGTTDQDRGINPKWSLDRCDYKDVRLIALLFYGSSWIPCAGSRVQFSTRELNLE